MTDEQIIETVYDDLMAGDGGYLCDVYPGLVVRAIRKVLEIADREEGDDQ